jgi:hypothetical protein
MEIRNLQIHKGHTNLDEWIICPAAKMICPGKG